MATVEYDEPEAPTFTIYNKVRVISEDATGTDDRLTLRALIAFVALAVVVALAPTPANVVGAIALVVLVLEAARTAWRKPTK